MHRSALKPGDLPGGTRRQLYGDNSRYFITERMKIVTFMRNIVNHSLFPWEEK